MGYVHKSFTHSKTVGEMATGIAFRNWVWYNCPQYKPINRDMEDKNMQTIIVVLNPGKLENADMDLRYSVSDRIEEVSDSLIQGNGYDFIDTEEGQPGPLMSIWLATENASKNWHIVSELFQSEKFIGNDLSLSAQIYISENDTNDLENCMLVFPKQ